MPRVLPPGTHVYVPPYILHRDARNFVAPDAFWPERWLVASGHLPLENARTPPSPRYSDGARGESQREVMFVHNDTAFIPFSHGPMNCVGKGLAMRQMRVVVCALVQRFRMRLALEEEEGWAPGRYEREFRDYLVANRPRLPVVLERRW